MSCYLIHELLYDTCFVSGQIVWYQKIIKGQDSRIEKWWPRRDKKKRERDQQTFGEKTEYDSWKFKSGDWWMQRR